MTNRKAPKTTRSTGSIAEDAAASYLEANGYRILARNFALRTAEVDIIAEKGEVISFIEVKSRSSDFALPQESVSRNKQRHIAHAALAYVSARKINDRDFRFDVIEVYLKGSRVQRINHLECAFEMPAELSI